MAKQERAARTRETLIRAAAEVFAEQGFVTASIAAISRRAGVSAGGLHFHFESKTVLAQAVEDRASQALRRVTTERWGVAAAPSGAVDGNALQALVDSSHSLMALLASDVVVRAAFGLCADVSHRSGIDLRRQWRLWVEAVARTAARHGALADGLAPQDAASMVVASTVGLETLGAREGHWLAPHPLTRFWTLALPQLAADGTLDGLAPEGSEGVRGPKGAGGPGGHGSSAQQSSIPD
ncbi:ScbR family autoregulator-binding transcription factor [Streptomyces sp. NBC_01233]|uniref:ScbR family autoregulator-binding transcription factor n=1 Tax=Streptomyces sp. NBC_01233 TaxID=2903787 RepID=UPI002E0E283E|nr:TetR/AcrR family transcriptional regulator [Streptomyces sp. NBC_01233]WSP95259.1 TetR/AcrR family transcriptional regulator [Streptomyces sp. NBC_01233]